MSEEQIKEARKLLESAQSLINTPAGYAIFNKINQVLCLLSEPCETCGGSGYKLPKNIDPAYASPELIKQYPCPDCQPAELSEKMLKHMLLERNKDIASVEIAYQAEIRKLKEQTAKENMNKEKLYKIFKPYIVKRKNGYCALLIPLPELDEIIEKITEVKLCRKS